MKYANAMKYVVDQINLKVIQVPDDYIECTVCHKWHPPEEFSNEDETYQTRTNCRECYNMDYSEMQAKKTETEKVIKKNHYKIAILKHECYAMPFAMTKEEVIKRFMEEMKKIPDGALVVSVRHDIDDFDNFCKVEDYPIFDVWKMYGGRLYGIQ